MRICVHTRRGGVKLLQRRRVRRSLAKPRADSSWQDHSAHEKLLFGRFLCHIVESVVVSCAAFGAQSSAVAQSVILSVSTTINPQLPWARVLRLRSGENDHVQHGRAQMYVTNEETVAITSKLRIIVTFENTLLPPKSTES